MATLPKVNNVKATAYSESVALKVTWDAVPNAVSYLVQYAEHTALADKWLSTPVVMAPIVSTVITGLKPGLTYDVRVTAS